MIELGMIRDLVTIFGVIAGFTYYVLTVRNAQKTRELSLKAQELSLKAQEHALETRQAQLFMQIYDKFNNKEFVKDWTDFVFLQEFDNYQDYMDKYGYRNNPEAWASRVSLSDFYEGIGVLINRKLIDPTLVDDLMSTNVTLFWEKWEPVVEEYRKRFNIPQLSEWQEYLYNRIKPLTEEASTELKT